jgi:hypothetical protein
MSEPAYLIINGRKVVDYDSLPTVARVTKRPSTDEKRRDRSHATGRKQQQHGKATFHR